MSIKKDLIASMLIFIFLVMGFQLKAQITYETIPAGSFIINMGITPQGVIGVPTSAPLLLPVFTTLTVSTVPSWTLDKQNGRLALPYFTNAGIPPDAHGGIDPGLWKAPAGLDVCDDIFVMPHADPKWETHQNFWDWNLDHKGSIWTACHAGSAMENMYNPANPSQANQMFLELHNFQPPALSKQLLFSQNYNSNK